jgi:hypothetical protein
MPTGMMGRLLLVTVVVLMILSLVLVSLPGPAQ